MFRRNGKHTRNKFRRRANRTHKLNLANPPRGGIRL